MDIELRPPLPSEHGPDVPQSKHRTLRDILSRMYVAAEVMDVGAEARFSSLVIFHRYACHYFNMTSIGSHDSKTNEDVADLESLSSNNADQHPTLTEEQERNHLGVVASACLFLGCKTEEKPRRIRDVINISHKLMFSGMQQSPPSRDGSKHETPYHDRSPTTSSLPLVEAIPLPPKTAAAAATTTTTMPTVHIYERPNPPPLDQSYWAMKETIVAMEQNVLRMLRFDVTVSHPHRAFLVVINTLRLTCRETERNELIRRGWMILNNASFHPGSLRHFVLSLACGALCIAVNDDDKYFLDVTRKNAIIDVDNETQTVTPVSSVKRTYEYYGFPSFWWRTVGVSDLSLSGAVSSLKEAAESL